MAKAEKHLAVALQGGGAHGAFTWGVLDRFLDEENLKLDGFVGTSAGAMNATVLAYGLHKEGNKLAQKLLHDFWKLVADYGKNSILKPAWYESFIGVKGNMDLSPGYMFMEVLNLYSSPYQSPIDYNPLKDILLKIVDFDSLRSCTATKLFVSATNVRRGRVKVFKLSDISVDAVLASANLPFLFKAVTIDGEDYWDGGYMGNPSIFPLIDGTTTNDIMLIQINPINIPSTPKTSAEIRDRVNELSFNSSLMLEMRKLEFIDRLLDRGIDLGEKFRKVYMHNINPEEDMWDLNISSKLNTGWDFLIYLRDLGQKYADEWIEKNYDKIGKEHTTNIRESFL